MRILDIYFGHLTITRIRDMLYSMYQECLIDSLQDGAVAVSDGTVRQVAQNVIKSIVHEKRLGSVLAKLHTTLLHTATTKDLASRFS